jgi:hypothetical protein
MLIIDCLFSVIFLALAGDSTGVGLRSGNKKYIFSSLCFTAIGIYFLVAVIGNSNT